MNIFYIADVTSSDETLSQIMKELPFLFLVKRKKFIRVHQILKFMKNTCDKGSDFFILYALDTPSEYGDHYCVMGVSTRVIATANLLERLLKEASLIPISNTVEDLLFINAILKEKVS